MSFGNPPRGSDEMGLFCKDADYFTLISVPFMGEKGMDYLVELKGEFDDKFE